MGRETGGGWARRKGGGLAACRSKQVKQILTLWSRSFNSKGKIQTLDSPQLQFFVGSLNSRSPQQSIFFTREIKPESTDSLAPHLLLKEILRKN
jgi:hypothetical protein